MDFSTLKGLTIPEGVVKKIESNNVVLWEEPSSYTNRMPISIDTDKSVFNASGYKGGYRISSSGATKTYSNGAVTGFIPAKANDIVRFKDNGTGLMWNETGEDTTANAIGYYDSNFAFLGVYTRQPAYYGVCNSTNTVPTGTTSNGGICSFTVPNNVNIAYFRMGVCTNHADGSDMANLIVTVNEEITD